MDRNTVIGLVLIFAILIGYSIYNSPSKEEKEAMQRKQDSIAAVQQRISDSVAKVQAERQIQQEALQQQQQSEPQSGIGETETGNDSIVSNLNRDKYGVFASSSQGAKKNYTLENDLMKVTLSSEGGKIISVELKEFQTWDSMPLVLFDPEQTNFGFTFFSNNRIINTNELYFRPHIAHPDMAGRTNIIVSGDESTSFAMRLYADSTDDSFNEKQYIEYRYSLTGNDYMIGFDVKFEGMKNIIESANYLDLSWNSELKKLEKSVDRFNGPTIYYKYYQDEVDYLSETKDDNESLKTKVKWISFKQRFFSSCLIAEDYFLNAEIETSTKEDTSNRYLKSMASVIGVGFSDAEKTKIPLKFYFGPNKFKTLKKYDLDLERQIPMGWSFFLMAWINRYAVIPVFDFLGSFGWNYGIIILILTLLLKLVLFPIAYKSYMSSARMRVLKPEIDEIGKKYPKKEDSMKKQQAVMALYKQAGVNPMAGCIPMLLQFPILIAMFRFFPSSFELRQQSFLWAQDLSSYDSIFDLPFNIPYYGDHVSLFTLLMTVSTIMYTRINNEMMASSSQQMPGMKTMMYLMPIMFLGLFNNYASGLSYYYLLANLITFGQMFLIRRSINEDKIRRRIEDHKKKPVKKSSWQKRLEQAAKQRGYKAKK